MLIRHTHDRGFTFLKRPMVEREIRLLYNPAKVAKFTIMIRHITPGKYISDMHSHTYEITAAQYRALVARLGRPNNYIVNRYIVHVYRRKTILH